MARNPVQFQKGLSEVQFEELYGTEEKCLEALTEARWPNGFVCPRCGHSHGHIIQTRHLYQCANCRSQTSLTAGTLFHSTKLPLKTWMRALYHLTQSKNGVSALELSRRLGVAYNTAWKIKHKLMQAMKEREAERVLSQRVELDDAYLGGERSGKSGRGAEGKLGFIAAVETTADRRPRCLVMYPVSSFTWAETLLFAQAHLLPGTRVWSDGLACFNAVTTAQCHHQPVVSAKGRKAAQPPQFRWVNTLLGNIKSALTGTYRHCSREHAPRYLAEFQYRFNHRFDLSSMLGRLLHRAARTVPMPYRLLKLAEFNE